MCMCLYVCQLAPTDQKVWKLAILWCPRRTCFQCQVYVGPVLKIVYSPSLSKTLQNFTVYTMGLKRLLSLYSFLYSFLKEQFHQHKWEFCLIWASQRLVSKMAWRDTWMRHPSCSFLDNAKRGMKGCEKLHKPEEKNISSQVWPSFLSYKRSNLMFFKIQQWVSKVLSFYLFGSICCQLQFIAAHFRRH